MHPCMECVMTEYYCVIWCKVNNKLVTCRYLLQVALALVRIHYECTSILNVHDLSFPARVDVNMLTTCRPRLLREGLVPNYLGNWFRLGEYFLGMEAALV